MALSVQDFQSCKGIPKVKRSKNIDTIKLNKSNCLGFIDSNNNVIWY